MKCTTVVGAVMLALACLCSSVQTIAQRLTESKITIAFDNEPLDKALNRMGAMVHASLAYNPAEVASFIVKKKTFVNEKAGKVLNFLLSGTGLQFRESAGQIAVFRPAAAAKDTAPAKKPVTGRPAGPGHVINGQVKDSAGGGVANVSVSVSGTKNGATTNNDGLFVIDAHPGDLLVFSRIGYKTESMVLGKDDNVNVTMRVAASDIGEVVVVGFGKQKKISVVGAITTIKPEELKTPSSTLSSSFAGKLAGVIAQQPSGEPGSGAQFWIRGVATYGGTGALIFLNGIEIAPADLNSIDPSNIESFSILKDASSTALYGARGANGVILIETKHGKAMDKPRITALVENSLTAPTKIVKFTDGVSYMKLYNEALKNDNPYSADRYSQDKIDGTARRLDPYKYPDVDWYKLLFKDYSFSQHANLNVQGGGKIARYYMGLAYYKDQGVLQNNLLSGFKNNIDNNRYNFVNNVNVNVTNTTELELNINADYYQNTGPANSASSLFGSVMGANAVDFPAFYPAPKDSSTGAGHIYFGNKTDGFLGANTRDNPYADMVTGYSKSAASTVITTLRATQKLDDLVRGLSFNALVSFKNWSSSSITRNYAPYYYTLGSALAGPDKQMVYNLNWISAAGGSTALGQSGSNNGDRTLYMQTTLNYNRVFKSVHDVSGMLVFLRSEYNTNIPGSDVVAALPSRKQGWAGRFAYGYDSRYYAEVNLGYTGSENFAAGHRYGFFPATGVSYVISNEKFYKGSKFSNILTFLKLRASYGLSGNDQIGGDRFPYLSVVNMNSGNNAFTTGQNFDNSRNGIQITRYPNNAIQWEISKKLNIGADLTLYKDLTLNIDWFREVRSNIYQQRGTIPSTAGVTSALPYSNIGKVLNRGIDATLVYSHRVNNKLQISARGTFTYAHNKVLYYDEPDYAALGLDNLAQTGRPLNSNWGLVAERLFIDGNEASQSPVFSISHAGDIKYRDLNKDGTINNNDRVVMGNPSLPEMVYGAGFTILYGKVDLGLFFQGTSRVSNFINNIRPFGRSQNNLLAAIADDHWSKSNQNLHAFYPRLTALETALNNEQSSSWWLRDFSFLRLKQTEIGYTPAKFVRIYVRGINLLTFSHFTLWDPEQGGGNGLGYPPQRVVNVGAQFNL